MREQTPKERFMAALRRQPVDRVPVPAFCSMPLIGLMDSCGCDAPRIHTDAEAMADFAMAGHALLGFEGIRLPTDGVFEAEALGCAIDPGTRERNPSVADHPFTLDTVVLPADPLGRGRLPVLLDGVTRARDLAGSELPVTSHFMGPVTLACHLVGAENLFLGLLERPAAIDHLLHELVPLCAAVGNALAEAGADALQFPDPMASPDLLDPRMYVRAILPHHRALLAAVHCPVVLHICGRAAPLLPHLRGCGAAGFSFDSTVAVADARQQLGTGMALVGNLAPTDVLLKATPESVRTTAARVLAEGIDVLAPGCGFAPHTPLANVRAMLTAGRNDDDPVVQ